MTPAERQKLYRQRQHQGLRVIRGSLAVDDDSLGRLADAGIVPRHLLEQDKDVLDAVSSLIDYLAMPEVSRAILDVMVRHAQEFR